MEYVGTVIILLFSAYIVYIYDKIESAIRDGAPPKKQEVKAEQEQATRDILETSLNTNMEQQTGTRDLFLKTLTEIGCQYEICEDDDDSIHFAYQGEHFLVDAYNDRPYLWIWDYVWGYVELHDVDEVSRLRRAINEANLQNSVTSVFTIDNTNKTLDVHCKATVLFIPEIPDPATYLRTELDAFFQAHISIRSEMTKLKEKDQALSESLARP